MYIRWWGFAGANPQSQGIPVRAQLCLLYQHIGTSFKCDTVTSCKRNQQRAPKSIFNRLIELLFLDFLLGLSK